MYENLQLEKGKVSQLILDREDKKNALNKQLILDLKDASEELCKTETELLIVRGKGDAFCSGLDRELLGELSNYESEKLEEMVEVVQDIYYNIRTLEAPVIAPVQGHAIGAGIQLALTADIRISTPDASFCVKEPDLGIIPDMGALYLLPRLVGDGVARELVYTARTVKGREAKEIGLVNDVYEDLKEGVEKYREILLSKPGLSLKESKWVIEKSWTSDLRESLEDAKKGQLKCIQSLKQD